MIKVLKAGFYTSIQDSGRVGFASIGVPVSGVMDSYSANIANSILNNSLHNALLEITFGGCKLQFLCETTICISGAHFSATINDKKVSLNSRIKVKENDVLSFGKMNFGARTYLAVTGGFLTSEILKSRSFYQNITSDFLVRNNAILPISSDKSKINSSQSSIKNKTTHFYSQKITCLKGPEFHLLNKDQKNLIYQGKFTISNESNRMGYRLAECIENNLPSILTSAVLPGTVQLTPSGKLIVLMRDCQVTGGYPRILQISEDAICVLSQKITGENFSFSVK